ncbi:MAG TPA: hypothetical protein VG165_06575 [Solirubrobacteraceae bacterium]|nr:hypothetical protein [Solirubrobacteraceae bacterium]
MAGALVLLLAVFLVAELSGGRAQTVADAPPFVAGDVSDVTFVFGHNLIVLALNAMACVAGFMAGALPPPRSSRGRGTAQWREFATREAIGLVAVAITYSLAMQTYVLGRRLGDISGYLYVPAWRLLVGVLPHAVLELAAMMLPLSAWGWATARGESGSLLAAAVATVALGIPMLLVAASVEVYVSPLAYHALVCTDVGEGVASQGGCSPEPFRCPPALSPQQFEARYHISHLTSPESRQRRARALQMAHLHTRSTGRIR